MDLKGCGQNISELVPRSFPVEVRTKNLPKSDLERCRYANLLGCSGFMFYSKRLLFKMSTILRDAV
jgi:hypothetical protein